MASASWPEPIWHALLAYFREQGIVQVGYHHIPPLGAPDEGKVRVVAEGFPDDMIIWYIRKKKYLIDPMPVQAVLSATPFQWRDINDLRQLSREESEFIGEMRDRGLGEGFALPAYGPGGRNGYFGLGLDGPATDITRDMLREFQSVCQAGHLLYCRMVRASLPPPPRLSNRETEILQWVAHGKSNGVIADIMELSPHTIDAHIRRIFLKLGTSDRISSVVRGLGLGIIRGY